MIVTKSTVPVGTGRQVQEIVRRVRPDLPIAVASNPEFLREGSAIGDFMRPDRVVIGTDGEAGLATLRRIYRPLYLIETPILATTLETAELIKYASNAFLAAKITFINEIADLCEKVGADVHDDGARHGARWPASGRKFLHPGRASAGSCFPKDTLALARIAQDAGSPLRLVETVIAVNEARKAAMADRIRQACGGSVAGKRIAVLGLTFKPETDDMREAPALVILPRLLAEGAEVVAYDPQGMAQARQLLPAATRYADSALAAAAEADALVLLTEWNEFRALAPERLAQAMRGRVVLDLRNVWDPAAMRAAGFALPLHRPPLEKRGRDTMAFTHRFDPTTLREYDIRGVVGRTLGEADAFAIGRCFGSVVAASGGRTVAVGYDGRLSSPALEAALAAGLKASGMEVVQIGLGPTPMLYYAAKTLPTDAGVMVTGSYNPPITTASRWCWTTAPSSGRTSRRSAAWRRRAKWCRRQQARTAASTSPALTSTASPRIGTAANAT